MHYAFCIEYPVISSIMKTIDMPLEVIIRLVCVTVVSETNVILFVNLLHVCIHKIFLTNATR